MFDLKRYIKILKMILRAKIIFKNPTYYKLVIFDDVSISDFKNFISSYNFFVLECRIDNINKIYFSLKILKLFLKNYRGNVLTAYLVSLLEIIQPKLVMTNIDNSLKFFDLARILDKEINFVGIQNAARYDLKEQRYKYITRRDKININKKFYLPNFFCFSQYEIDSYNKHKIKVKNFYKIGSLRLANFFHYIKKKNIKLKKFNYDICFVSEDLYGRYDLFKPNYEKRVADVIKFTIQFCMKHNMKLIILIKREETNPKQQAGEINFYKSYLTNEEYNYFTKNSLKKNLKNYSSYRAMFESKVTVGTASTLLRENLCTGRKVLSCNLAPTNLWDFPIKGICLIKNCNYNQFEKRLLRIYSMSKKNYFQKINRPKEYLCEYKKKISTIEILKERINYFLSNKYLIKTNRDIKVK